jgi:hypothetical protein
MSDTTIDIHTENLASALKAKKKLAKLYATQVEMQDKVRERYTGKIAKLIESLSPEVARLIDASAKVTLA